MLGGVVRRVNIHEWATPRHVGIEGKRENSPFLVNNRC